MQITADRAMFAMKMEELKQQPIWGVRRRSAEYYMLDTSLYLLGTIQWRTAEDQPWTTYYVSMNEMNPMTGVPLWHPLSTGYVYDNTLIDGVIYAQAEEVYNSQT